MKNFLLALLVAGFPAAAGAQEYFIGEEVFRYYARPFRDRAERFQSARADALQMRLAVNDESDGLTLENWGDNRADLRAGDSSLKAEANFTGGSHYSPAEWDVSGNRLGAYGRFGRLEFEGLYIAQKSEKLNTATRSEFNRLSGGVGMAFGPEELSFGLHANVNRAGDEDWEEVTSNNSAGAALALKTDLYELGLTADIVDRGTTDDSNNYKVPRSGPQFGAQAMLKPFAGLKAALRAGIANLKGDNAHDGATVYNNYKADLNETGARLEWRLEGLPLTLGLEYAKMLYETSYTGSSSKTDATLKTAGAALRLLDERLVIGGEAQDLRLDTGSGKSKGQAITGGVELWILPGLAARGSYQLMHTESGTSEQDNNCLAAGLGFKGESFTLDGAVRVNTQDEDAADPDKYTDIRVVLGLKF